MTTTQHTAKTPSAKTGRFAVPFSSLRAKGSGAPSDPSRVGGRTSPFRLLGLAVIALTALLALTAAPASAAASREYESQITEAGSPPAPFSNPMGLAVDGSDNLWVSDVGPGLIDKFGPFSSITANEFLFQGNGEGHWTGQFTQSIAFSDASAHLYVADSNEDDLWVLNSDASFNTDIPGSDEKTWGHGCCFIRVGADNSGGATDGDLYVSGKGSAAGANAVYRIEGKESAEKGEAVADPFSASASYIEGAKLTGTPSGPFATIPALAVGPGGELFVATPTAVYEFEPSGEFSGIEFTEANNEALGSISALAVDPTSGHLLVADSAHAAIDEFAPNGEFLDQISEANGAPLGTPQGLAVDSAGTLYASDGSAAVVDVFGPAPAFPELTYAPVSALTPTSVTVGAEVKPNGAGEIEACSFEYGETKSYGESAPCSPAAPYAVPTEVSADIFGLTPSTAYHYRIVLEAANGTIRKGADRSFTTTGPPTIDAQSVALPIAKTSATIEALINPHGFDTTYKVKYGTTEAYGSETSPVDIGSEATDQAVATELPGLQPGTIYHYRILATNSQGTVESAADQTFTTEAALSIDSTSVSAVSADSATLEAQIDPLGDPASYRFEYLTEAEFQENLEEGPGGFSGAHAPTAVPVPDAALGSGVADVEVSQHLQGLQPHTVYHYRVVARSELAPGVFEELAGPDRSFTTQTPGPFALPDGRSWEMVSPPDKHGGQLGAIAQSGLIQAAAAGDAISYTASAPIEVDPHGYAGGGQILSTRAAAGWSSIDLDVPHPAATGGSGSAGGEYRFFSEDLSLALVQPFALNGFTPLSPDTSEPTPYLRTDFPPADPTALCTSSCYRPLVTGCPISGDPCPAPIEAAANVPPGTEFGRCELIFCGPYFRGATPDLAHVVLSSEVGLTSTPGDEGGLYEWAAGAPPAEALRLISVLPGGEPANLERRPQLGEGNGGSERNAISADGSRVIWVEREAAGSERHLYLRDNATQPQSAIDGEGHCTEPARACTIQLDQVQGGPGAAQPASPGFQLASADGSRVFFTDSQQLTAESSTGNDLYECRIHEDGAGELACDLTDLTPETAGEPAEVQGSLPGASADGSSVYFVANGVLAQNTVDWGNGAEEAEPGHCVGFSTPPPGAACNLYFRHEGTTTFIASLSGKDRPDWAGQGARLRGLTARVSHDGRWLAFMSERPLTGYDNRDAVSGEPDQEVFVYDANANGGAGGLICASCNPTGARPHGVEYKKINGGLAGGDRVWSNNQWLAANIPGWTPYELNGILYQSRYLSDSGRLFFNASDSLVPSDTNGNEDVYEFEPPGLGDCTTESVTFAPRSGGCKALISSGTSGEESGFLDASESGDDVFFLTNSRLSPRDFDTSLDVYDARVGGGFPEPVPTVECAGDACQQPAVPPNDSTPGTLTVHGPGNEHPKTAGRRACRHGKVRRHGRCIVRHERHKGKKHKHRAKHHRKGTVHP